MEKKENEQPTVKVAALQGSSVFADVKTNTDKFTKLIEKAAEQGAKIMVLPEAAITGYASQDLKTIWRVSTRTLRRDFTGGTNPFDVAQTVSPPGSIVTHFSALAKKLKVYISIPFVEKDKFESTPETTSYFKDDSGWAYYNALCLVNPDGELIAHYRKVNLWPHVDHSCYRPGKDVVSVDTEYGRVGLGVCFDVHVILDRYKPHKLWTLLYSIAWVDSASSQTKEWFSETLPERLREVQGGYNLVGANWAVDEAQKWSGYGYSTIYTPAGKILAQAEPVVGDQIIYAELPYEKPDKSLIGKVLSALKNVVS